MKWGFLQNSDLLTTNFNSWDRHLNQDIYEDFSVFNTKLAPEPFPQTRLFIGSSDPFSLP